MCKLNINACTQCEEAQRGRVVAHILVGSIEIIRKAFGVHEKSEETPRNNIWNGIRNRIWNSTENSIQE